MMRLRALYLSNVRKFDGRRASITGIGDGITVISEANEFGKSTFFDAIHALFFDKFSSSGKAVKSLQPYSKGPVEVAAEIETDDGQFRIEKRFLSSPRMARVVRLPDEAIIAQDDEAERWIITLLGQAADGPAGLLWVRQGLVGLEPEAKAEKERLTETRRDLLSSVSGEIDAMTGGRRMDRIMRRVREDLGQITTPKGRKTGAWKALDDEVAGLETELAALNTQIGQLETALAERKQAENQLRRLEQPEVKARRTEALTTAQRAFEAATAHAVRVEAAAQARELAALNAQSARRTLDHFLKAVSALETAQNAAEEGEKAVAETTANAQRLQQEAEVAQAALATAKSAVTDARAMLDSARKQGEARVAQGRAEALQEQLRQAEEAQNAFGLAEARVAASAATPAWLRDVETGNDALVQADAALAAQSVTATVTYSGANRISRNGHELPEGAPVPLVGQTTLALPDIGDLVLNLPENGQGAQDEVSRCREALTELLRQSGVADLSDARNMAKERAEAVQAAELAKAVLKTIAPDGVEALRAAKAAADLAVQTVDDTQLPPIADLEAALELSQTQEAAAQRILASAIADHTVAREAAIRAQSIAQASAATLERAAQEAGPEDKRETARTELLRADAQATADVTEKTELLDELRAAAPDMATAKAELTRTQNAVHAAEAQLQQLNVRLAEYSAEIRTHASNGIEELRDEVAGRLDAARAEEARIALKAAALTRLQAALEAERVAARDTYFGPVQAELKPLLAILYQDAGLSFDSDSLLPAGMTRADTQEAFTNLSGGTQEQIAILTRLAFARLFAKQGRHMPIVLDDALVYSDDDRIVKMFTALNRVAQDQQILVFTCRTMAFADLGGAQPAVAIRDME